MRAHASGIAPWVLLMAVCWGVGTKVARAQDVPPLTVPQERPGAATVPGAGSAAPHPRMDATSVEAPAPPKGPVKPTQQAGPEAAPHEVGRAQPPTTPSQGAEGPAIPPTSPPGEVPYVDREALEQALEARNAQILALRRERAQVPLARGIALSSAGMGLLGAGLGFAASALVYSFNMCPDDDPLRDDCLYPRSLVFGIAGAGGSLATAGTLMLAFGLPRLRSALRRRRELSRQIRELQQSTPELAPQPASLSRHLNFSWSF